MPPGNKYTSDVSSAIESVDRPTLKNLTASEYGNPQKSYNELLESLGMIKSNLNSVILMKLYHLI